jgi:hypothetical protein
VEDVPLLARIVSRVRSKGRVRASEIVPGMTEVVVEVARKYRRALESSGVELIEKRGGVTFYPN